MNSILIITGGSRGLGKELIDLALKDRDFKIISISRTLHRDHSNVIDNKLMLLKQDLSSLKSSFQQLSLKEFLTANIKQVVFVNNAATILPIENIGDMNELDLAKNVKVNILAPMLITNDLIRNSKGKKIKVINISSGTSKKPIVGWSLYSSSKAAIEMFFDTLKKQEESTEDIEIYNIDPGVMDTGMQKSIRSVNTNVMPDAPIFQSYFESNKLNKVYEVANMINSRFSLFNLSK